MYEMSMILTGVTQVHPYCHLTRSRPAMSDSEQNDKADTTSVDSKISTTVSIFCSCDKKSCRTFWCGTYNSYWRLLSLGMSVVVYLVLGGVIFSLVEGPNERRQVEMVQQERAEAFENLTSIIQDHTNLSEAEARNLTVTILALGEVASRSIPAEVNPIWDYSSAFFFSSTVITTIGEHRITSIVYSILPPSLPTVIKGSALEYWHRTS